MVLPQTPRAREDGSSSPFTRAPSRVATTTSSARVNLLQSLARAAGAGVSIAGGVVLVGWAFDITPLKGPVPGIATMKANTAMAFGLAGLSLWLSAAGTSRARAASVLAAAVMLLALTTLSQDLFGWNLGLDQMLFRDRSTGAFAPGRMAPMTAFCLAAFGAAVLASTNRGLPWLGHLLTVLVALLAGVACIGYLYNVEALYGVGPYTTMAVHTALLLFVLAVGLLFAHPAAGLMAVVVSDSVAGATARRLVPVAVVTPIVFGWLRLQGQRAGLYGTEFGLSLMVVSMIVVFSTIIWWNAGSLRRLEGARRRAQEVIRISEQRKASLLRLSKRLEQAQTFAEVLEAALDEVKTVMGYQTVWAYVFADDGETMSLIDSRGTPADRIEHEFPVLLVKGDRLLEEILAARDPIVVEDAQTDPRTNKAIVTSLGNRTIINVPMMLADRQIGAVGTGSFGAEGVNVPDRGRLDHFSAMASHIAVAFDRVQLLSQRARAMAEVRALNADLERRVAERTAQLEAANKELEAFSYSVSHDLRAPLRHIDGFSQILLDEYAQSLDAGAQRYLAIIRNGADRMGHMIDDLLHMARVDRQDLMWRNTDLNDVVADVIEDLQRDIAGRVIDWHVETLPVLACDPGLIKLVFANLISNAVKYTRTRDEARIDVTHRPGEGSPVIAVADNGVGFDEQYAGKLFGVFQRLHRAEDFEGTGVGLATVQRILHKHGGRVWARAAVDKGATFFFTLGKP